MAIGTPVLIGTAQNATDSTAISQVTTNAIVAIDDMVIGSGVHGSTAGMTGTLSDSDGVDTYTEDLETSNDNNLTDFTIVIGHTLVSNAIESSDVVKVTWNSAFFSNKRATFLKCSGLAGTLEDSSFVTVTASTAPDSGNIDTTTADCLLVGICMAQAGTARTYTAPTNWSELSDSGNLTIMYRVVSSTGTYNFAPTMSANDRNTCWIGAFPIASAGDVTVTPSMGAAAGSGNAPSLSISIGPSPGGAIAQGNAPVTVDVMVPTPGGSIAQGNAPTLAEVLTAGQGAAVAAGPSPDPTVSVAPTPGGSTAGGYQVAQIDTGAAFTPGGAVAGGAAPDSTVTTTPTPGGAIATGKDAVTIDTVLPDRAAATAQGNPPTLAGGSGDVTVQPSPGAAVGAGNDATLAEVLSSTGATATAGGAAPVPVVSAVPPPGAAVAAGKDATLAEVLGASPGASAAGGVPPVPTVTPVPDMGGARAGGLAPSFAIVLICDQGRAVAGGFAADLPGEIIIPLGPFYEIPLPAIHMHGDLPHVGANGSMEVQHSVGAMVAAESGGFLGALAGVSE